VTNIVTLCGLQQDAAVGRVVPVVLQRIGDRLRDDRVRGKVHHRVKAAIGQDFVE